MQDKEPSIPATFIKVLAELCLSFVVITLFEVGAIVFSIYLAFVTSHWHIALRIAVIIAFLVCGFLFDWFLRRLRNRYYNCPYDR